MPRLTSSGPPAGPVRLKHLDKPVSSYSDEELDILIAQCAGVRGVPPVKAPKVAKGPKAPTAQAEIDFENLD